MRRFARGVWARLRDFCGAGDATYLWPRWFVLRAVGVVYILIFAGILEEGQALVGPRGLIPLAEYFAQLHQAYPQGGLEAFLRAPSLFWLGTGTGLIALVSWAGLLAAVALVLNLWPRVALFVCWLALLSFVTTWGVFSGTQLDRLMLEVALLCIPFAPAGLRPGLGAASPPRPIAVFIVRWLLFRIMFESGLVKIITGDPHWRDLTAMDMMYETSPFPTLLGYYDQHLPHAFHLVEIALTFLAEIVAPVLAVFGGRRGRWAAFAVWVVFQAGIQLTNNFGWLNTASIALGVLLLDDQMLATAADRLGRRRLGGFLASRAVRQPPPPLAPWRRYALGAALWTQFGLTFHAFGMIFGLPVDAFPFTLARPVVYVVKDFFVANPYTLYARVAPARYGIEFEGSNDRGRTWRAYEYRYQPQRLDRICPFIAPWFPRFEGTLQIESTRKPASTLYPIVAAHLLERDPAVIGLFRRDPFPDRPPTMIRMPTYRVTFTDAATHRATGNFWHKEYEDEYVTMMYLDTHGQVVATASVQDEVRILAENGNADAQARLGAMYASGDGVAPDLAEAFKWFHRAAELGLPEAQNVVGLMYAAGSGVARDDGEALVWFNLAARAGHPDAIKNLELAESQVSRAVAAAARLRSEVVSAEIEVRKKGR